MSLINKMLQELDRRHAAQAAVGTTAPASAQIAQNVRPVKSTRFGSDLFWWVMAGAMVVAIVWLIWVMWQLTPHTVVNELALRSSVKPAAAPAVATEDQPAASVQSAPAVVENAAEKVPLVAESERKPGPDGNAPPVIAAPLKLDMLKLATEITTPIPVRPARIPVREPARGVIEQAKAGQVSPPVAVAKPGTPSLPRTAIAKAAQPEELTPPPSTAARPASPPSTASANPGIDKRNSNTGTTGGGARERAEADYRRAVTLINQGRLSEGMDILRTSLAADGSYEQSRQTLVALLVEQRRMDEAVVMLQQGLDLNPTNSASAMLLARILVERQDIDGALGLLRKYAPAAGTNADYHAFAGALYQRLGRHGEAIDEYQTALRFSPQSGIWWVGLGISQEASDRRKEAADSFRRARSAGKLGPDLLTYVDQRLRQLQ